MPHPTLRTSRTDFSYLFNRAISFKHQTGTATIADNILNGCGRVCIQLGRKPNTEPSGYRSVASAIVAATRS